MFGIQISRICKYWQLNKKIVKRSKQDLSKHHNNKMSKAHTLGKHQMVYTTPVQGEGTEDLG
ncbi:hypothetical protein, partial [Penaeicola halotolerans]|uniref:hypothetical protein n=1 Tax=Penaeicola halotolerans TaxID=2793196 RepID=UPI001CF8FFFA